MIEIGGGWDGFLKDLFESENYRNIREFLKKEYRNFTVYPSMYDIFNCFKFTPLDKIKVVLLGQDPYHNEGQAMGLSFSVREGIDKPPSLINIEKELYSDLGIPPYKNGDLSGWAKEGVLLLNASLTVRAGAANSHSKIGWGEFTDGVIKKLSDEKENLVFILWGGFARSKKPLIDTKKHFVIESAHPSPLSAYSGFFGSKPFSKTNTFLISKNITPVNWDRNKIF